MNAEIAIGWHLSALLGLAVVFAFGLFDALILKRKDWACAIWFIGLTALSAWIASGVTALRISIGVAVFVSGLALMTAYYRGR